MTRMTKEPKSETFRYGFLTSRTARLLYEHSPGQPVSDESRLLLERAEQFVAQILNGEAFVSGEKENLTPSLESLYVLRYGREALAVLQQNLKDRAGLRHALGEIQHTISTVRDGERNGSVAGVQVEQAAKFFDVIADALLQEAIESSHPASAAVI